MNQIEIKISSKGTLVADGAFDLKTYEFTVKNEKDAEKFNVFKKEYLDNVNKTTFKFKDAITESCKKNFGEMNFGLINAKIVKSGKGFAMKKKPAPSLEDLDGGRRSRRSGRSERKTRRSRRSGQKTRRSRRSYAQ